MAARSDSIGPDSVLEEELDVLRAIYIHELVVEEDDSGHPSLVHLTLHPATGDDVTQQFVCMTLVFNLPQAYPDDIPEIIIKNPRGLAEEEVQRLQEDMIQLADDRRGGAMLFELIEMAKEILTEGNIPRCPCVVCMEHFQEGDLFTRTDCYHYFHQACLARYVEHALSLEPEVKVLHIKKEKEEQPKVLCPVCRNEITFDLEELKQAPDHVDDNLVYRPSEAMIKLQQEMAELYSRQKAKGGIIDLEAEKNRYLVNEGTMVTMTIEVPEEIEPVKKPVPKSGNNDSGRPHYRNNNIVAKYKGPPRRNRPNSSYQGRKSPNDEKSSHTENVRRRGDNSDRKPHKDTTREYDEKSLEGRGRGGADHRGGRDYKDRERKNYHGGRDQDNRRRNQQRQDSHFEERDGYRGGSGGNWRGGRGGSRQGYNRNDHDRDRYNDRDRYDDRTSKKKDSFDHSDMKKEVEDIHQKSSQKHSRRGYQRLYNRNTTNSCDSKDGEDDKGDHSLQKDGQNMTEVTSLDSETRHGQNLDKQDKEFDREMRNSDRKQDSRQREKREENWDKERTVMDSPEKTDRLQNEKPESSENRKVHKGYDTNQRHGNNERRPPRTKRPSESEDWDDEVSCSTKTEKGENMDRRDYLDRRSRDGQQGERREWGRYSRGRGYGRRDRGGREGPHSRNEHRYQEHSDRERHRMDHQCNRESHGQTKKADSQSEVWNEEKGGRMQKREGKGNHGDVDRKYKESSRSENWDSEKIPVERSRNHEENENLSVRDRGHWGQGRGGQHPRSGWGKGGREFDHKSDRNSGTKREGNGRNESRSNKNSNRGLTRGIGDHQHKDSDSVKMNSKPEGPKTDSSTSVPQAPPGLKAAPGVNAPPGIKVPRPDVKAPPPGLKSPGIRITGPPPGFDSNSKKAENSNRDCSSRVVTPPPGFDFR